MISNISVKELKNIINSVIIIDIRSNEKYNSNHINGAINIPKNTLIYDYEKYLNKINTYYIYCQKGINSVKVCSLLSSLGYKVVNIIGGYESWIISC